MGEEFEFRDLSNSSFWGVDLSGTTFRDVDLSGVRMNMVRLVDVEIDAEIDRIVINGVDVTATVNAGDPWYPLRSMTRPTTADDLREGWRRFTAAWNEAIARAGSMTPEQQTASVDGEWSFVQTLRHLVMATDKWFSAPILGLPFHAIGLPNTGSMDVPFPGIDLSSDPGFDEAVSVWRERAELLRAHVDDIDPASLETEADVMENGPHAVHDCIGVVFEEHFHHLRYALRDLDRLTAA